MAREPAFTFAIRMSDARPKPREQFNEAAVYLSEILNVSKDNPKATADIVSLHTKKYENGHIRLKYDTDSDSGPGRNRINNRKDMQRRKNRDLQAK